MNKLYDEDEYDSNLESEDVYKELDFTDFPNPADNISKDIEEELNEFLDELEDLESPTEDEESLFLVADMSEFSSSEGKEDALIDEFIDEILAEIPE